MSVRSICLSMVSVVLLCGPSLLHAGPIVIFTDQSRETSARARDLSFTLDSQSDMAVDFGPWESLVEASVVRPEGSVHADASQESILGGNTTLGEDSIVWANGSAAATSADFRDMDGLASSQLDVTFQVTETIPYELTSSIRLGEEAGKFDVSSSVGVEFRGPSGLLFLDTLTDDGISALTTQGILEPGDYTLSAVSDVHAIAVGAVRGSFFVHLAIPEPITATLLTFGALIAIPRRRRNSKTK